MPSPFEEQFLDHQAMIERTRALLPVVAQVAAEICSRLDRGGTVFTFGNGGSAADAQHLAAELVGRYLRHRGPLAAVALSTDPSVTTCIANDYGYEEVFARQVSALVGPSDVVVAFSTSGGSPSVVKGLAAARGNGALTILLTGETGGEAAQHADRVLGIPSSATARIQEGHVLLLHLISDHIDRWAADEPASATGSKSGTDSELAGAKPRSEDLQLPPDHRPST
jgi:D-sedoheptulose 7-phosphate isomerase